MPFHMSKSGLDVVFCTLIILFPLAEAKTLVFVNVVWRHGDRSYMQTYPNDPYKTSNIWKNGFGQLTDIGIKEQYELGRYLRSRYGNLLSRDYLRKEIYVRSTDKDRTLMSAQSNMAGLYPPTSGEMWNGSSTVWQPVPLHTVPVDEEKLLSYPIRDCPNYNKIMAEIRSSSWFLEHERNYSTFYKFIHEKTGLVEPCNLTNIWQIEDNLFCLQSNNYTLPVWANSTVLSTLKHLNSLEMGLMFTDVDYKYRKSISRLQGGVLLKQILSNLTGHVKGETTQSMIAYSAHDTTLTALLVALGNYDWVQPQYASCIMLELYKDGSDYFVEVFYRRGNGKITQLQVYDCAMSCPLAQFAQISQDLIPDDHNKLCGKFEPNSQILCDEILIVVLLCTFVVIIVYIALYVYCRKSGKTKHEYSRIRNDDHTNIDL